MRLLGIGKNCVEHAVSVVVVVVEHGSIGKSGLPKRVKAH
jgi:hypothetical protein